jgi:hypothetical protein
MPLTLPSAYSNAIKATNIAENWIIDLYGDVDSGYTLDEELAVSRSIQEWAVATPIKVMR